MIAKTRTTERPSLKLHRGLGPFHALLIPGLVPDGAETFLRVRSLFQAKGNVSILTFPYTTFDLAALFDEIDAFLTLCARTRKKPVLVGVSVGGGFLLEYLRRASESGRNLTTAGIVLISPLSSPQDLAPLLRRLWNPIVSTEGDARQALEKGRNFFRQLATRSTRKSNAEGWQKFLQAFTPTGLSEIIDAPVRKRIEQTLEAIPAEGAIARCLALSSLRGLDSSLGALSAAPTLILWGSRERHTLDVNGPGVGVLCRPDLSEKFFPDSQVQWIYGKKGESVPHASLLKHDKAFAPSIRQFLARI